jgi:hypothetical protein
MAEFELRRVDSLKEDPTEFRAFKGFLQQMVNRRSVGALRYGLINKRQKYMSRMLKEAEAYKESGNREQLLNIAVYAFLESYAPENKKFHDNPAADSVTRKIFGL